MAERDAAEGALIDVLYSPQRNEWNGNTQLQLRLRDVRPATRQA